VSITAENDFVLATSTFSQVPVQVPVPENCTQVQIKYQYQYQYPVQQDCVKQLRLQYSDCQNMACRIWGRMHRQ